MGSDTPSPDFELRHRLEYGRRNDIATRAVRSVAGQNLAAAIDDICFALQGIKARIPTCADDDAMANLLDEFTQTMRRPHFD